MEENSEAAQVYMQCRGQLIIGGMGTVIDLNIPAVKIVMDLMGVEDQMECLTKVMKLFHFVKAEREAANAG